MNQPKFNSAKVIHWAIWDAAGLNVAVGKQNCSPRCIGEVDDTPRARQLVEDYERGASLDIPHKRIMEGYQRMLTICKTLQAGRIGGGL